MLKVGDKVKVVGVHRLHDYYNSKPRNLIGKIGTVVFGHQEGPCLIQFDLQDYPQNQGKCWIWPEHISNVTREEKLRRILDV